MGSTEDPTTCRLPGESTPLAQGFAPGDRG